MEAILGIVGLVIVYWLFGVVFSAGTKTVGAAAKAVVGNGSFSDNMNLAFKGMNPIEARIVDTIIEDDDGDDGLKIKAIEIKGLFPLTRSFNVGFITSIFDKTDGELKPVLSAIEMFQEPGSIVYQNVSEIGEAEPDTGFVNWVRVGGIIPELLQPPIGGTRNYIAILRMVNLDNPPDIELGFHSEDDPGIMWQTSLPFTFSNSDKGYEEAAEHRDHAKSISVKIGIAVAMADGTLDDSEGEVLKTFVHKAIAPFSADKQKHLKDLYNGAMKDAHAEAKKDNLSLSDLTSELNDIADTSTKYETIELCFDVMAADGVADAEELKVIRLVADALDLDLDEIEKMRDQKIVGLDVNVSKQTSVEEMLGIETDWPEEDIKRYLRTEFQKWNDRMNTLSEGVERDKAQQMLELISEARKKYG